jgi:GDP-mannose 6-dehydrogenase
VRISIFGLGYVGAVSLACLARDGHSVIGVDIDRTKLDLLRRGGTPIIEAGMAELLASVAASGRVQVTADAQRAVHDSDLSFVCVGTPSRSNGSQDLGALERLCTQVGEALRSKATYHVVVVRSTVLPGTVDGIVAPLLAEYSGKRRGVDFDVCFQPEFLREGSSIRDYDHPPYTVVGADSARAVAALREVFGHLPCEFRVCDVRTAEMLKYCSNVFHAVKVTFANEVGRVCQALGVDPHAVMELLCADTQLNLSPAYLHPGFAFGGSCLPKELRAFRHLAGRHDVAIPMVGAVADSNRLHIDRAVDLVLATERRAVGLIGLAFKAGTDDLRESPLVVLAERFIGKGLRLRVYDPEVNLSRLVGANRRYIEESIPHIASLMTERCEDLIDTSEVLVVGLRTGAVVAALRARCRSDHVIVDLVNLPERAQFRGEYRGVCW